MGTPHHRVVIVGTGFSGLGMAIRLAQRGERDFVLLERADDVGGTWRDNRYPGCACDIPSRLYSFSFDQKPDWSRDFATAEEIWSYLRDVADRYAVRERVAFGADLASAVFDEGERRWSLAAADGRQWTADALVLGVGALHEPRTPAIPGLDTFGGPVFHSARWPEDDGLDGKRVAVVGTGASSVQMVPALAPRTERLTVFQRTAAWVLPKEDRLWSERRQRLFARHPALQRAVRWRTYWGLEYRAPLFTRAPAVARLVERYALRKLHDAVSDLDVRRSLTPDYTIGCKRIVLSDDYWPAFERDDVDLVTDPIARVEPGVVVTAAGDRHEVEAIVLGTGFDLSGSFDRIEIRGRRGRSLAEAWSSGMHTHLGITVAGFPELYLLLGPNTGLGHNSVVLMIEFATRYVLECLERGRSGARDTTSEAQSRFTREMLRRSRHTVWTSGCRSWYLDRFGNNTAVWPGSTLGYWWRTRRVDDRVFEPVAATSRPAAPGARCEDTGRGRSTNGRGMGMTRQGFEPRVSIVTGAGSGIGRAIAAELAVRGSHVVIADIDAGRAHEVAAQLGATATAAVLDVADAEEVHALVRETAATHGRLDVMVNNAGVAIGGRVEELDERHWTKALDVNLRGVIHGVRAAYPVMSAQRSGHILNTASLAGLVPAAGMLPYTTTKHAVVGLSTGLRAEAASRGVRVSVLCPAFVDTPLLDDVYAAPPSLGGSSVRARVRMMQPRFLTAELVARRAVDGLAANRAIIPVGWLAHTLWRLNRYAPPLARGLVQAQATIHRRLDDRAGSRAGRPA